MRPAARETSPAVVEAGVPLLGICYGQQAMVHHLKGQVEGSDHREFGRAFVEVVETSPLFEGVWPAGTRHQVWMSHGDRVTRLPEGFSVIATSEGAPYRGHRRRGPPLLRRAVPSGGGAHAGRGEAARQFRASHRGARRRLDAWRSSRTRRSPASATRWGRGVSSAASPAGVDSAVAAVLIHEAIGEQLTCIFVDHGLMRQNEAEEVVSLFRGHYNIPLVHVDASDAFLGALEGESDPETKRKTIGRLFIETFEAEAKKIAKAGYGPISWRRARSIPT